MKLHCMLLLASPQLCCVGGGRGIHRYKYFMTLPHDTKSPPYSHVTGSSSWLAPQTSWTGGGPGLPAGWLEATDKEGRTYYVK